MAPDRLSADPAHIPPEVLGTYPFTLHTVRQRHARPFTLAYGRPNSSFLGLKIVQAGYLLGSHARGPVTEKGQAGGEGTAIRRIVRGTATFGVEGPRFRQALSPIRERRTCDVRQSAASVSATFGSRVPETIC